MVLSVAISILRMHVMYECIFVCFVRMRARACGLCALRVCVRVCLFLCSWLMTILPTLSPRLYLEDPRSTATPKDPSPEPCAVQQSLDPK